MPPEEKAGPGGLARAKRIYDQYSTLTVGNSKHIVSQIAEWVEPSKTRLVYSGPFPDDEADRPVARALDAAGPKRLLLIGRITDQKRQEDAVRALGNLVRRGWHARLTLLGTPYGGYELKLDKLAAEEGVRDRIEMPGYIDNPRGLYESAHVNLNCTFAEPLGRTILEGMAFGTPTVAARGGGTPEVIEHGESGLLYEPGDVNGLTENIERMLKAPDEAEAMAVTARAVVLPFFTRSRYVGDMVKVMEESIALGPAPSTRSAR
jgi:glycosyltransferase involved in cell wall biosynthesis